MLGSSSQTGASGWRRRKGGRDQWRCVFLQAEEMHSWLDRKRLRQFREEDTGEERGGDYVTLVPRWEGGRSILWVGSQYLCLDIERHTWWPYSWDSGSWGTLELILGNISQTVSRMTITTT